MKPFYLQKHIADAKPGTTIYILGATGIGKTHAMKEICDPHWFWLDSMKCVNIKEFRDTVEKQLHTSLVSKISNSDSSKRVIIIDELEVFHQLDRAILGYVAELKQNTHVVVVICNISLEKKIKQTTPNANIVYFSAMSDSDICLLLRQRFPSHSYAEILNAAECCYGNITQSINMLIFEQNQNETDIAAQSLYFDDIFKNQPRHNIVKIVEDDPWLVPLRYHENIHKVISRKTVYRHIIEGMCIWDMLMQLCPSSAYPIEYFTSIVLTTYPNCKKTIADFSGFTKLLSNMSLQKKNEKLMYSNDDQDFPWVHSQIFCDYIKYR